MKIARPKNEFPAIIRGRLESFGLTARGAALRAGLPIRSIQSVLEGHDPSMERGVAICGALKLEVHIHPFVSVEGGPVSETERAALRDNDQPMSYLWKAAPAVAQGLDDPTRVPMYEMLPRQSTLPRAEDESVAPSDQTPVRDPILAELLAWLGEEWEALNPHGRERLRRRFEAAFPEFAGGRDLDTSDKRG